MGKYTPLCPSLSNLPFFFYLFIKIFFFIISGFLYFNSFNLNPAYSAQPYCIKYPPTRFSPIVQSTCLLCSALLYKIPAYSAQPYCSKYSAQPYCTKYPRLLCSALLYKVPAYSAQPHCIKYLPTLLNPIVQNTRLLGSALLYKRQTVIFILSFNIKFCLLKCALFVFIFINVHEMFLFSFEKSNLNFIFLNFNGKKLELIQIKSMKFILRVGIGYNKTFFTRFRRC